MSMTFFRIFLYLIVCAPAFTQSSQLTVHLIPHSSVESQLFMGELKCMLEKVFKTQIVIHDTHQLDLSGTYKNWRRQYGASEILGLLADQKRTGNLPTDGYSFYIIEPDMYDGSYNYLFGLMNFTTNINVISLARLRHEKDGHTTDRVFRLVAKNIAKFHGHKPSGKCFMGFSNSLGELDSRDVRLCEPDLGALQSLGLVWPELKDQTIMRGCALIM